MSGRCGRAEARHDPLAVVYAPPRTVIWEDVRGDRFIAEQSGTELSSRRMPSSTSLEVQVSRPA
jgi:hypothetical protein